MSFANAFLIFCGIFLPALSIGFASLFWKAMKHGVIYFGGMIVRRNKSPIAFWIFSFITFGVSLFLILTSVGAWALLIL